MPKVNSRLPELHRSLSVRADSLKDESRTVDLVFATEIAASMWHWDIGDYDEVLECSEPACDLRRLRMGGALLSEHCRDKQIGVIEAARFENGQGIATVRFDEHPLAEQEWKSVKSGIRRNFSVGYRVKELTAEKVSEDDGNVYRATSWEPLEISLVSVPADVNCQAIREAKDGKQPSQPVAIRIPSTLTISTTMKRSLPQFFRITDTGGNSTAGASTAPTIDQAEFERQVTAATEKRLKAQEDNRRELRESAQAFKDTDMPVPEEMLNEAIDKATSPDQFRKAVLAHYREQRKSQRPTLTGPHGSGIQVLGECSRDLTLGQRFVQSEAFKRIQHVRASGGKVASIQVDEFDNFRATFTTSASITGFNGIVSLPGIVTVGVQRPTVADLLSQGTTNLSSVPYMLENAFSLAATSVAQGGAKPEATFTLTQTFAPVVKIAVTLPVADEAFEDISTLSSYIDGRLRYSVEMEEEDQLLNGAGSGSDLTGLLNTSGVLTQALGADTVADAIHKGITKIKTQGFATPTGIILHPNDWQDAKLAKDANGQYFGSGPFTGSYGTPFVEVQRFWGLPVVETTSMTENSALIVTMMDAMIFRKKGITVDSTNSHASEFANNITRIRAEERLALAVFRPKSFCIVTGI